MSEKVASQRYRSIHVLTVPLAWCLEGDRRVSAVLLLPQVECLTINTVSNSPTQKAVTVFKRPFILSSHCTGEAEHVSLQPFADYRHKCTATYRCNCHPCRNILTDFKLDYVSDSLIPTASPFPSAAEGHLPTTDGIGAKYDTWMNDTDCYHISAGVLSPTKLKTLCIGMLHFVAFHCMPYLDLLLSVMIQLALTHRSVFSIFLVGPDAGNLKRC